MNLTDGSMTYSTPPIEGLVFWPNGQRRAAIHDVVELAGCANIKIRGEMICVYFDAGRQFEIVDEGTPIMISSLVKLAAALMNRFVNGHGNIDTGVLVDSIYLSPALCKAYPLHTDDDEVWAAGRTTGVLIDVDYQ